MLKMGGLPSEQLKIFMDINENQKAVSPTLRTTLEKDLFWNAERADSRIKALKSSIIEQLGASNSGPLFNKISWGEDKSQLSANPFGDALIASGLLPKAKGNSFEISSAETSLYNTQNLNHNKEMYRTQKSVVSFINKCYGFVEENYSEIFNRERNFIVSNRGTSPFIKLIGSLNTFESIHKRVNSLTPPDDRFEAVKKYLNELMIQIQKLPKEEEERLLEKLGRGVEQYWLRYFQSLINQKFPEFLPDGLSDWKERQDSEIQDKGRKLGTEIEKFIKKNVIKNLKTLFGDNWDIEIGQIQRECEDRAKKEIEKRYKEGLGRHDIPWTDMFNINDYKKIIESYWTKNPESISHDFKNFEDIFSINIGHGFNSKSEKLKWLSLFNSLRNNWAHEGTKEKGLNKEDVKFLQTIHDALLGV